MAKKTKLELAAKKLDTVLATVIGTLPQPTATVTLYGLGKLPRNGLNEGTKHGNGGTAGTYAAVVKALKEKDGALDMASIQSICVANNDKGFARYAVRNHWLQPIVTK